MSATAQPKPTAADHAEAEALLARKAVADVEAALAHEKSALEKLVARRDELALDDAAIRRHVDAESVIRIRVAIIEKQLAAAQARLAPIEAAMQQAARRAAYDQAAEQNARLVARFTEVYERAAAELLALFEEAEAAGDASAVANKARPDGAAPLRPAVRFGPGAPVTMVVIEARDGAGATLFRANQFGEEAAPSSTQFAPDLASNAHTRAVLAARERRNEVDSAIA